MFIERDVADRLLEAVLGGRHREVAGLCAEDARLQAALPVGVIECHGPAAIADAFESWFGRIRITSTDAAERSGIGNKTRLRWRLGVTVDWDPKPHVIEQVCFVKGRSSLRTIDLACSGFVVEPLAEGQGIGIGGHRF